MADDTGGPERDPEIEAAAGAIRGASQDAEEAADRADKAETPGQDSVEEANAEGVDPDRG